MARGERLAGAGAQLFPMTFRLRDYKAPGHPGLTRCSLQERSTTKDTKFHEGLLSHVRDAFVILVVWCVSWFDFLD
jgi:hypothetical protein